MKLVNLEAQARHYFQEHQYHKAWEIYNKLDSLVPDQPAYIYPLGICYLNGNFQEDKALLYFEKCLKQPEKYPKAIHYYAGKAYHLNHQLDQAIEHFEIYKNQFHHNQKKYRDVLKMVAREIEMCENGRKLMASPLSLDIKNIGPNINSLYPDYGPVISADQQEMLFTSSRPGTTGGDRDPADGKFYEDIYISYHSDSLGWGKAINLGDSLNTNGHDATVGLSEDGQYLILYRYDPKILSLSSGNLFYSELKGKAWGKAVPFPSSINSNNYEPSASLSPDGNTLYFVSNRPGGQGGTDIYTAKKLRDGSWATPQNLGKGINTEYDEDSPFIHSDGKTLYFSSSGHNTMGGFDIFVSHYNESTGAWSEPQNIGYPINTAHDDTHFSWAADGRKIFLSSKRKDSYGDLDIYYAILNNEEPTKVLVMKGFVFDSLNHQPLHSKITVIQKNTSSLVGIFNSNTSSGQYLIVLPEGKYHIEIEAENHNLCKQDIDITTLKGFEIIEKNITLCPKEQTELNHPMK